METEEIQNNEDIVSQRSKTNSSVHRIDASQNETGAKRSIKSFIFSKIHPTPTEQLVLPKITCRKAFNDEDVSLLFTIF